LAREKPAIIIAAIIITIITITFNDACLQPRRSVQRCFVALAQLRVPYRTLLRVHLPAMKHFFARYLFVVRSALFYLFVACLVLFYLVAAILW
jgi:hypothetical protein